MYIQVKISHLRRAHKASKKLLPRQIETSPRHEKISDARPSQDIIETRGKLSFVRTQILDPTVHKI